MSIIRRLRLWVTGHDTAQDTERVDAAIAACRDLEVEANKLQAQLDRINRSPDPLGELVHSMRTGRFRSDLQQHRWG